MKTKEAIKIIDGELTKDFKVIKNLSMSSTTRRLYTFFIKDVRKLKSCNYHDFVFWFRYYKHRSDISRYVFKQVQKQLNQYYI